MVFRSITLAGPTALVRMYFLIISAFCAAIAARAVTDPDALIGESQLSNQAPPTLKRISQANASTNQLAQQPDEVPITECLHHAPHLGPFNIDSCKEAREEMHRDEFWPDKKATWTSERAWWTSSKEWGSIASGCVVSIRAHGPGYVASFTLADLEAGLILTASKCITWGRGGFEWYPTVDQQGKPVPTVSGWQMSFYNQTSPLRFLHSNAFSP